MRTSAGRKAATASAGWTGWTGRGASRPPARTRGGRRLRPRGEPAPPTDEGRRKGGAAALDAAGQRRAGGPERRPRGAAPVRTALADRTLSARPQAGKPGSGTAASTTRTTCAGASPSTPSPPSGSGDLTHLARERPDDPATWHVTEDDIRTLRISLAAHHGPQGREGTARHGRPRASSCWPRDWPWFHPSRRQPLPRTPKLRQGVRLLSYAVITVQAMREWDGSGTERNDTETSVMD